MLRILLLTLLAAAVLPQAAHAAVLSSVSGDTLTITGDGGADQITLRLASPRVLQVNGATFNRTTFSHIAVRSGGGADEVRIDESGGVFTDTEITSIETGAGADVVSAGAGAEVIAAGDDGDVVSPGAGDDTVLLGAGDDTVVQGEADARDRLEGQTGSDTLRVLGTAAAEEFTVQAFGTRALFTRDTSPARADTAGIETAEVNAAGGGDLVDIGSLGDTAIERVDADLGVIDGARDQVAIQGSAVAEVLTASVLNDTVRVTGDIDVRVESADETDDRLTVFGSDGGDALSAAAAVATRIQITLDGGAGGDTLSGSGGADVLRGGPGGDVAFGRSGNDVIDLGDGDDEAVWNPGDGNDIVDGGTGSDKLTVNGSSASERFVATANGTRARLTRDVAVVVLDLGGVERLGLSPRSGADQITVSDLAGTGLTSVITDLASANGFPNDGAADELTVDGTQGKDTITVTGQGDVQGTATAIAMLHAEPFDKLTIRALGGDDVVDSTGVFATGIRIQADGGEGSDTLLGGKGDDVFIGGNGPDVLFAGSGDNVALGGAGDDVLRGEEGDDVLDGGPDDDILIGNAGDDVLLNGEVVFDD